MEARLEVLIADVNAVPAGDAPAGEVLLSVELLLRWVHAHNVDKVWQASQGYELDSSIVLGGQFEDGPPESFVIIKSKLQVNDDVPPEGA